MEELVWQFIDRVRDGEVNVPLLDLIIDYPDLVQFVALELDCINQYIATKQNRLKDAIYLDYIKSLEREIAVFERKRDRLQQVITNYRSMS